MLNLTSTNVEDVFLKCLFKEGEDNSNNLKVEGVNLNVMFNPNKIEKYKDEIFELISQLPDTFFETGSKEGAGGGWSFLNLCLDNKDNTWTGLHTICDQLLCLGIATNKMQILLPRIYWQMFPGCVPYVCVKN